MCLCAFTEKERKPQTGVDSILESLILTDQYPRMLVKHMHASEDARRLELQ